MDHSELLNALESMGLQLDGRAVLRLQYEAEQALRTEEWNALARAAVLLCRVIEHAADKHDRFWSDVLQRAANESDRCADLGAKIEVLEGYCGRVVAAK